MPRNHRLEYLRRARVTVHAHLARLEPLVAGYHAKLAEIEAEIQEHDPQLRLQPRKYKPNPIFARRELPRLALTVLREAGEPLPIRVITVRVLAAKGIAMPDPTLRRRTRNRLRTMFAALDRRGVTVRIGDGNAARRGLSGHCYRVAPITEAL